MALDRTKTGLIIGIVIMVLLLIPFPTESVPEWEVKVVNRSGDPLPNMEIIEEWSHSSVLGEYKEEKVTDKNGIVKFPARTFFCPLLLRIFLKLGEVLNFITGHGTPIGGNAFVSEKKSKKFLQYRSDKNTPYIIVIN